MQSLIHDMQASFDPADIATLTASYHDVVSAVGARHAIDDSRAERIAEIVIECALRRPLLTRDGRIDRRAIVVETAHAVLKEMATPRAA